MLLDGQPEEEGHEQHHPSVDAKGGGLMKRLGAPAMTMRMLIARLMSSTKEHEQEAGAKHDDKDLAKGVDMDVISQPVAEAGRAA